MIIIRLDRVLADRKCGLMTWRHRSVYLMSIFLT